MASFWVPVERYMLVLQLQNGITSNKLIVTCPLYLRLQLSMLCNLL